jgi:hypothetical protein
MPEFKGYITDLGGPTANMYGYEAVKNYARVFAIISAVFSHLHA